MEGKVVRGYESARKTIRCSGAAAFCFISATLGCFIAGMTPAVAVDLSGCRGDQACVKIAQTTQCDSVCQRACKATRHDYVSCFAVWGPKFEFVRSHPDRRWW
jgi:hypothetical protein